MFDKNQQDYEKMNNQQDNTFKSYSAQVSATQKQAKMSPNIPNSSTIISDNNHKQQSGDFYGEGSTSKFYKKETSFQNNYSDENQQSYSRKVNVSDIYLQEDGREITTKMNSKLNNKINSSGRIPHKNKYINDSQKRNYIMNSDFEDEEHLNNNSYQSDIMNHRVINQHNQSQNIGGDKCGQITENIETQCDDDIGDIDQDIDEEDTSSEFIKELLQNEKKLTQKIYCSEIKALKITKIFNDLIFSMKSELLAYLTLEDICRFKQAFQYYLGRYVTKTIDSQILKLIWVSEPINNELLWDTLINYSFLKEQYPVQYQVNYFYLNIFCFLFLH